MFNFQHPNYLWMLAVLPVLVLLFIVLLQYKKEAAKKIGDHAQVILLTRFFHPRKFLLKFILLLATMVCLVIALANPRSIKSVRTLNRSGIDLVIVLDVSNSMLAEDISPNRLERVKQILFKLIPELNNNRVGLIVFAGKAYLQMPITTDLSAAKMYIFSASPASVSTQGTAIGEALRIADLSFNPNDKKYKSVLLMTDGEAHDNNAIENAKKLALHGTIINVVGFGSHMGTTIKNGNTGGIKLDELGKPVITKLNEGLLRQIAFAGNGIYLHYTSTDKVVKTLVKEINAMPQRKITDDSLNNYASFFQWFASIALILLVVESLISERRKRGRNMKQGSLVTLMVFMGITVFGQSEKSMVDEGNRAFYKNHFSQAIELYQNAERKGESFIAPLNLGNALYKNKQPNDAQEAYNRALQKAKKPLDKSEIYFNKGVVYQNNKHIQECVEAYKNTLRINPEDERARQNLQHALRALQHANREQQQQNINKEQEAQGANSKMTKREADDKLKALQQQEQNLHEKLKKNDLNKSAYPEKDW